MASPFHDRRSFATPIPGTKAIQSTMSDENMWKRLREAGFDKESIKRRDKASLIAHIAKLETEVFEHQHQMGLIILENKHLSSKYEEMKSSYESAELKFKREKAAHSNSLAEARKREGGLEKTLGVKNECITHLEKASHEMRVEYAETKLAFENKWKEACKLMDDAGKKHTEAESKIRSAEIQHEEANRCLRITERKLKDIETREDDLQRRITSFKLDCDAKEKEMMLERQAVNERQIFTENERQRLLEDQGSMVVREGHIFFRTQELNHLERSLADMKEMLENQSCVLGEEKSKLEQKIAFVSSKEKDIEEKETLLSRRENELLMGQRQQEIRESLKAEKALAEFETELALKRIKFEEEMERKRKLLDDEMERRRRAWELREVDLLQREELLAEREHETAACSKSLAEGEDDVARKMKDVEERERLMGVTEGELGSRRRLLREEEDRMGAEKSELEKSFSSLEERRRLVEEEEMQLLELKKERGELVLLGLKLKEEVDHIRGQRAEVAAESARLGAERAAFETEWEAVEERREASRREADAIAVERAAAARLVTEALEGVRAERETLRERHRRESQSLREERGRFTAEMERARTEWFTAVREERARLEREAELRRREVESRAEGEREEAEGRMRAVAEEGERALREADGWREAGRREAEHARAERELLEAERASIGRDRELCGREWAGLGSAIEELKAEREKLEAQRGLLNADRSRFLAQIEKLRAVEQEGVFSNEKVTPGPRVEKRRTDHHLVLRAARPVGSSRALEPSRPGWVRRCADLIFKNSPGKPARSDGLDLIGGTVWDRTAQNGAAGNRTEVREIGFENRAVSEESGSDGGRNQGSKKRLREDPGITTPRQPGIMDAAYAKGAALEPDLPVARGFEISELGFEIPDSQSGGGAEPKGLPQNVY